MLRIAAVLPLTIAVVALLVTPTSRPPASAVMNPIVSVDARIDDNGDGTPDNGPTTVGNVDPCHAVSNGASFMVDLVFQADPTTVISGFQTNLLYNPAILNVSAVNYSFLLASTGQPVWDVGETTPDLDGNFKLAAVTFSLTSMYASGPGVLARVTLQAVGAGTSPLDLTTVKLSDASGNPIPPSDAITKVYLGPVNDGSIVVGPSCCVAGDSDCDGVLDAVDNCPMVPNGPAQAGIPGVGNQTDSDGDGLGDACDPEDDGDGYLDTAESWLGTDPLDNCGNPTTVAPIYSQAWPADLVSSGLSANKLDIQDLASYVAPLRRINTGPGDAAYHVRWDLAPGAGPFPKAINIQDLTTLVTLAPLMFGNTRAFNHAPCTP